MKSIGVREAKNGFSDCLRLSQDENVVIMKHGHPVAVLAGAEGLEPEDVYWGPNEELLPTDPKSWKNKATVSHEEVVRRLGLKKSRRRKAA